jgi:hypothetical protein
MKMSLLLVPVLSFLVLLTLGLGTAIHRLADSVLS